MERHARWLAVFALVLIAVWAPIARAAITTPAGRTVAATAGVPFSGVVATFQGLPSQVASSYGATIDWGDGSPTSGGQITDAGLAPGGNARDFTVTGTHTYATVGQRSVTVTIVEPSTQGSAEAVGTADVTAASGGGPASATFTVAPAFPVTGQDVQFDGTGSVAPGGRPERYDWSFDGGATFPLACDGATPMAHHAFEDPGIFDVVLRVADGAGASTTTRRPVEIGDAGATDAAAPASGSACGSSGAAQLAPGLRGAPTLKITAPEDFAYYDGAPSPLTVSGELRAPEGYHTFCVTGPEAVPGLPAACDQKAFVHKGHFDVPVTGIHMGYNFIDAWLRDVLGNIAHDEIVVEVASARNKIDVRAQSIEVTQGIQLVDLPERRDEAPDAPVPYEGVRLATRGPTVVRLYANAAHTGRSDRLSVKGVEAVLYGYRKGKLLPGAPLSPDNGAHELVIGGPSPVYVSQRLTADGAYVFTLPPEWTHGTVTLVGEVNPPIDLVPPTTVCVACDGLLGTFEVTLPGLTTPRIAECETCIPNNRFALSGVLFEPTAGYTVSTVQMTDALDPTYTPADPWRALSTAAAVIPVAADGFFVYPVKDSIEVGSIIHGPEKNIEVKKHMALDALEAWENRWNPRYSNQTIGLTSKGLPGGLSRQSSKGTGCSIDILALSKSCNYKRVAIAQASAPDAVAHEFLHGFELAHAGETCPGADTSASGGLGVESWPPDGRGYIHGVGLDRRPGSGGSAGPYRMIGAGGKGQPAQWYDFTSYCAGAGERWISTTYWQRVFFYLNFFATAGGTVPCAPEDCEDDASSPFSRATAAREAAGQAAAVAPQSLLVQASLGPGAGEGRVSSVEARWRPPTPPAAVSPFALVVRSRTGEELSRTPMAADTVDDHDLEDHVTVLRAEVPYAVNAGSVEVVQGDTVRARRVRSAHPPTLRLSRPRRDELLGRRRTTALRWKAADADSDPLWASVDYSPDDGRHWRPVHAGPERSGVSLPSSFFSASQRARVRVSVSDGFDQAIAVSSRFRHVGTRPTVTMLAPGPRMRLAADATLALRASAFDDHLHRLAGRSLRWFVDGRPVERGADTSVTGLSPGRRLVRVVARDRTGRTTTARRVVRVQPVTPRFLRLRVPARVSRRRHTVRLRVGATLPAVLTVREQRFHVVRRARSVAVPLGRSGRRGPVRLTLVLSAGGRRMQATVIVRRR